MDLSALLAREGIRPGDVETLLQWARQRASVLIARIEPGSQLAELLAGRERTQEPAAALQPAARSVPLPIARSVSRPYLNAAVEAALSGKHDVQLALENAAPGGQALPERPVLEDIPEPAPEPAEDDPSIGGFNRFAFALRKRAPEPAPEPTPRTANLTRGFELHAESQGPRISWDDEQVPEPPGFEARLSESARMHIANLNEESSDGLVLGIPDDDGDIPVYRGRPRSQAIAAETSSSGLTDAAFDAMIEPSDLEPVTPELGHAPSGPHTTVGAPSASSDASDSGPITTASGPHAAARPSSGPVPAASGPHAAARPSSGPVPAASGPHAAARPSSGPVPAASGPHAAARPSSGPVPAASGPHAAARSGPVPAASGPQPAASQASSDPVPAASGAHAASGPAAAPASAPPPRPASAPTPASSAPPHRRGKKTQPQPIVAVAKPTKPEPRHEGKKGKQRKKVVELSQPVARPVSAPSPAARPATLPPVSLTRPISAATPMATPTSSSPATPSSRGVPDYLRDDED